VSGLVVLFFWGAGEDREDILYNAVEGSTHQHHLVAHSSPPPSSLNLSIASSTAPPQSCRTQTLEALQIASRPAIASRQPPQYTAAMAYPADGGSRGALQPAGDDLYAALFDLQVGDDDAYNDDEEEEGEAGAAEGPLALAAAGGSGGSSGSLGLQQPAQLANGTMVLAVPGGGEEGAGGFSFAPPADGRGGAGAVSPQPPAWHQPQQRQPLSHPPQHSGHHHTQQHAASRSSRLPHDRPQQQQQQYTPVQQQYSAVQQQQQPGGVRRIAHADGKVEEVYPDGRRAVHFTNGTVRPGVGRRGLLARPLAGSFRCTTLTASPAVMHCTHLTISLHVLPSSPPTSHRNTHPPPSPTHKRTRPTPLNPKKQVKLTDAAGHTQISFRNGDLKRQLPSGRTDYYYSEVGTWQVTHPCGVDVFYFPSGQREAHHGGGVKEIVFPDGGVRRVMADG